MVEVSVIVPVYNREKLVTRCLDSISRQSVAPREIIVVDNGSTDNTYNTVKDWINKNRSLGTRLKLIKESRKGACRARQRGLEASEGNYLIFFDSDDEMRPNLIEEATNKLSVIPSLDIVCWQCRISLLDGSQKIPSFDVKDPIENHLIHTLLRPQGYMVRKEFLESAGGWEKPVKVWNDYELGLRLLLNDPRIAGINKVLAEIYAQEESITGKDFSSREGEWEKVIHEMEEVNSKSNHPQKKRISKILNYRKAILAAHYYREGNKEGAENLLKEALTGKGLKDWCLLQFTYHYTKKGLRGVWRLVRFAY